jgi:hypothetical protein
MADGTEICYDGTGLETAAPREFVLRFMSSQNSFWDATHWSEDAIAVAFEEKFASSRRVRREQRVAGSFQFVIRPTVSFA